MASKATGLQIAVMVEDGQDFDPQAGFSYFQVWRGRKPALLAKESAMIAAGWKTSRRKWSGPGYELYAVRGSSGNSGPEVPVDRWRIVAEQVQLDIRANPKIVAAAVASDTLALWIKSIDAAIAAGQTLAAYYTSIGLSPTISDEEEMIYGLKAMGADSFETHRPVLTRIRTISPSYEAQFALEALPKVYTTPALRKAFSIPHAIANRLPKDPSETPPDSVWGWKIRQQESDILLSTNRIEELVSWTFAAWSELLYDIVT